MASNNATRANGTIELLIAGVTPQNLERGVLWFSEHEGAVKKARAANPWWHDNTLLIEQDLEIKPSFAARRIAELGYERGQRASAPGMFAVQGSIIQIWPINKAKPFLIEFTGNVVSHIKKRTEAEEKTITLKPPPETVEGLRIGSFVVHVDHGIGIYRGLTQHTTRINADADIRVNLRIDQRESAYFVVEYAPPAPGREPDKLFVPVTQKDRLTPYVGFETPRIHRLGGTVWQTTKRKVHEDALKLARELLELYAKREQVRRPPHPGDTALEQELRDTFPYQETPDQLTAEQDIIKDLSGTRPMDRILCGDVGFGKTEIALRAVLHVIASEKQVVLLSPTTILAAQHEKTLRERFAGLPVAVVMLSRLTPKKDEKKIIEDTKQGRVDVVVGTHRLLSKDVEFRNLGLVVIDEEQRFGVRQKEKFKDLRADVDILSLSATPIPRTLHLALANLRDISVIRTPPPERKS
ncbi:MAG: DEAD/DEAH box helicase, partial [Candidatus Sungiibacteriota bacterium]